MLVFQFPANWHAHSLEMEFGHGLNPAVAPVSEQQLYTRSIELISERDYSVGVQTEEYITLELGVSKAVQQPNGGVCKEGYLTKKGEEKELLV